MNFIPYCGLPPAPSELLTAWKLDPILIGVFLAILVAYRFAVQRWGARESIPLFLTGWTVALLAFVSPLCAWSMSLFSARIGQHMILVLAAAPLLALGCRGLAITISTGGNDKTHLLRPVLATACFALTLWFWHAPAPYAWTFKSDIVYWTMHATLLVSAVWLWGELFKREPDLTHAAVSAATMMQMSILGALLALAPSPLFAAHFASTMAWGLSPLEDQQFGGALMWVVGGFVFLALSLVGLWRLVEPQHQRI